MPSHHDDDCDCAGCKADEDRFWREQGEGRDRQGPPHPDEFDFDVTDVEDDGPCSHVFNGDRCELCGAEYDPIAHGHRIVPEDSHGDV